MFYVYTYIIDGVPRYVGKGVGTRWMVHRKARTRLGRVLAKHKRETGEWILPVIQECESEGESLAEEIRLVALYGRENLSTGTLFNLTDGGDGVSGYHHTEEHKEYMSQKQGGINNPFYGKTHSPEVRQQLSELHTGNTYTKGRKLSDGHRRKISRGISGDNNPACKVKKEDYPKLLELRKQGLLQKEIGKIVGLTQAQVSKILRSNYGRTTISREI